MFKINSLCNKKKKNGIHAESGEILCFFVCFFVKGICKSYIQFDHLCSVFSASSTTLGEGTHTVKEHNWNPF